MFVLLVVLADLRYDVEITGVEDSSLADLLDEISALMSLSRGAISAANGWR
jgi:hypothetical protein